jgi:hypothetical protein
MGMIADLSKLHRNEKKGRRQRQIGMDVRQRTNDDDDEKIKKHLIARFCG